MLVIQMMLLKDQTDITNFVKKFLNEEGEVNDIKVITKLFMPHKC